MFDKGGVHRSKNPVEVTISLTDGELFDASVFLRVDERLIDLLNDPRAFIPVKREDGPAVILAKTSIVSIVERVSAAGHQFGEDHPDASDEPHEFFLESPADERSEETSASQRPPSADDIRTRLKDEGDADETDGDFAGPIGSGGPDEGRTGANGKAQRPRRAFDPYRTLRVSRNATDAEVRRAYKARIKAVHPDTFSGLEVDDELSRAAILATQKVNTAYNRIMRQRREAEQNAAGARASDGASDEDAA